MEKKICNISNFEIVKVCLAFQKDDALASHPLTRLTMNLKLEGFS